ncbi:hypothetical protein [Bdellovibrio sp. BCCA]|uniref:hypothetical protein n=1 Tax=unclassified Bdellovibrio TaxID=2633795 RepID=UPI0030F23B0A
MPEIKNYDGKKKHHSKAHHAKAHPESKTHQKRRPHHEAAEHAPEEEYVATEQAADEAEAINTEAQNEGVQHDVYVDEVQAEAEMVAEGGPAFGDEPSEHTHGHNSDKVHLEFYGSELIRQKAPKVMELADTVADEWKHDGQFEGLPVGNPIAQMAAAKALRTAKDVEKKLEEKGVIAMAKMGIDFVKSKIEKKNY